MYSGSFDDVVEPISESFASSLSLSPRRPRRPRFLDVRVLDEFESKPSFSSDQADQLMSSCEGPDDQSLSFAPLPPAMALPLPNSWNDVYIPEAFRRLCGIRPNYIIVCPSPIQCGFDASMRGFVEAMDAAPSVQPDDIVPGGCYAARVPGIGVGGGGDSPKTTDSNWTRVVTAESNDGRWRVFCGDIGVWAVEPVHYKDMRLLPAQYLAMPFQAIVADLNVDPVKEVREKTAEDQPGKYRPETFKLLQDKLKGASLLQAHVRDVILKPSSWPRVKITLSSLIREDKPDCLVRALVKKNLASLRD